MTYTYTNQKQIGAAFREQHPDLDFKLYSPAGADTRHNRYCTDTRMAFRDFIDQLARNNEISDALAHRATL